MSSAPARVVIPRNGTQWASAPAAETAAFVAAAKAGDEGAFAQLHRRFGALVHGVLLARVEAADAEDLLQEVFLTALRRLADLREPAAFGSWVCQIARRHAAAHHRRRPPTVLVSPDELPLPDRRTHEAAAVLREIQALPDAYVEPLILRLIEGMSGAEIAAQTGLSPKYVRVNIHRGLKLLRRRLGREEAT